MSTSTRAEQPPVIRRAHPVADAAALVRGLDLARLYLPNLAAQADAENPTEFALAARPAAWAFAALMWRAAVRSPSTDPSAWWASTTDADWAALGFPVKPGRRQAVQYLPAALKSNGLDSRTARAVVCVLGDMAAAPALPGSHVDTLGKRRILRRAA